MIRNALLYILTLIFLTSCFGGSEIRIKNFAKNFGKASANVSSVSIVNDQLIINGSSLDGVTGVRVTGPSSFDHTFAIESQSSGNLVANGLSALAFAMDSTFNLILTDAEGAASFPVTFTLVDGSVTAQKLDQMGAGIGQVLKWNGTTWVASDLGGLTYAGNWHAGTNTPDLLTTGNAGEYYIVNNAGTTNLAGGVGTNSWAVGDWVVWNDVLAQWEKIDNATNVTSFNGRNGAVSPQSGDYTWTEINKTTSALSDIANVEVPTGDGTDTGKVLKWNNATSAWELSDDLSGGGAGSVTSTEIANGSIVDADINASAAIAQSKINGLTTDLAARLPLAGGTMTGDITFSGTQTFDGVDVSNLSGTVGTQGTSIAANTAAISGLDTDDVSEATNLYFTTARARTAAVLNSTAGTETDQAPSVAAVKAYVSGLGAGDILDGGNTEGSAVTIGTNDAQSLNLETNNVNAMTINSSGNIGIGTSSTGDKLTVLNASNANVATVIQDSSVTSIGSYNAAFAIRNNNTTANTYSMMTFQRAGMSAMARIGSRNLNSSNADFVIQTRNSNTINDRLYIQSAGNIGVGTSSPDTKLHVDGTLKIADGGETCTVAGEAGMIRYNTGNLEYCNGSSWQALGISGSGLTTFNGETGGTQNLAVGATGTAPAFVSATNTHTLNIPLASGAGVTSGTISKTDYDSFAAKQDAITTGTTAQYLRGDLSLSTFGTDVLGSALTGYSAGAGTVVATDTVLQALQKLDGNVAAISVPTDTDGLSEGSTNLYFTNVRARTAAVLNTTAGTETDQAPSVAAMKSYVTANAGTGDILNGGNTTGSTVTIGTNDAQDFRLEANGAPEITIQAATGFVGIGTTNPSALLEVRTNLSSDLLLVPGNNSSSSVNIVGHNGGGAFLDGYWQPKNDEANRTRIGRINFHNTSALPTGGEIRFDTLPTGGSLTTQMVLDQNGQLGIGTTSPSTKLDVEGKITVGPINATAGNTGAIAFEELAANGTNSVSMRSPDSLAADYTLTLPADDGDNGEVLTTDGSGVLTWSAAPAATSVSAGAGNAGAPSIAFSTDTDTGIFSGGADVMSFAVGGAEIFSFSTNGITSPTTGGGSVSTANGTAAAPTFGFAGDADTGWFRPAADTLAAATGGSERVRIDSSGNVGIGTTNPVAPLQINDHYRVYTFERIIPTTIDDAIDIGVFTLTHGAINLSVAINVDATGNSISKLYQIPISYDKTLGAWTTVAPIKDTGAFSSDNFHLDLNVNNNIATLRIRKTSGASAGTANISIQTSGASSASFVSSTTVNSVTAPTSLYASTPMTQTNSNVGIGTLTPAAKLDIAGDNSRLRFTDTDTSLSDGEPAGGLEFYGNDVDNVGVGAEITAEGDGTTGILSLGFDVGTSGGALTRALHLDGSSGNVGIGSTSPRHPLHIAKSGTGFVPSLLLQNTTGGAGNATGILFNNYPANWRDQGAIAFGDEDSNSGCFRFMVAENGNLSTADLDDTTMSVCRGTAGVGTKDPTNDFHIHDPLWYDYSGLLVTSQRASGTISGGLTMSATVHTPAANNHRLAASFYGGTLPTSGNYQYSAGISSYSDQAWTDTAAGADLRFFTTENDTLTNQVRMLIDNTGNVGIGTGSPVSKLDVQGKLTVGPVDATAGNAGAIAFEELTANGTSSVTMRSPDSLAADYTLTLPADDGDNGEVLTTDGSGLLTWSAAPAATSVSAGAGNAGAPSIAFSTDTDTGIFSGGADVMSFAVGGAEIFSFSTSGITSPTTGGGSVSTANGTAAAPTFSFAGDADTGWFRPAGDELAAATGGSERVRIDSSGNVGIGTTSPSAKLQVTTNSSNLYTSLSTTVANPALDSGLVLNNTGSSTAGTGTYIGFQAQRDDSNHSIAYMGALSVNGSDAAPLVFGQRSAAASFEEKMRIDFNGKVGIGTINPQAKLEIEDDVKFMQFRESDGTANKRRYDFVGVDDELRIRAISDVNSYVRDILTLEHDGNVGIGTTNPGERLEVDGTIEIAGGETADDTRINFAASDSSNRFQIETDLDVSPSLDTLGFRSTNQDDLLVLQGNGNVGIGTRTPATKLEVVDEGKASQVSIKAYSSGGSQSAILNLDAARGTLASPTATQLNDRLGGVQFRGYDDNSTTTVRSSVQGYATENYTATNQGSSLIFETTANGTTTSQNRMIISDSGNVGIGTLTPDAKLQVLNGNKTHYTNLTLFGHTSTQDSGGLEYILLHVAYDGTLLGAHRVDGVITAQRGSTGASNKAINWKVTTSSAYNTDRGNIVNYAENANLVYVDYGGVKYLAIEIKSTSTRGSFRFDGYAQASSGEFLKLVHDEEVTNVQPFTSYDNFSVLGNVGVGTTTPASKLEVNGEVKIGNSGAACTGSNEGATRYNSTSKKMEFCNGTIWAGFEDVPDYVSGWVADNNSTNHLTTFTHSLGSIPTKCELEFAVTNTPTTVYKVPCAGHVESSPYTNPVSTRMTSSTFQMSIWTGAHLHAFWSISTWTNWSSGYWRIRLWR